MLTTSLLVFIGPSGSGKSAVVRELHRRGVIEVTPSWTTRPRRDDEHGSTIDHRFVTEDDFTALAEAGYFLEVVRPFGLPYRYGLPPVEGPSDGRVAAIMVRAPFMPLVVRHFLCHVTYQIEDSFDRAKDRVVVSGGAAVGLGTRLEGYEEERRLGHQLASRVFLNEASLPELIAAVAEAVGRDFAWKGEER